MVWDRSSTALDKNMNDFRNWENPPYHAPNPGDRLMFPLIYNDNMLWPRCDLPGEFSIHSLVFNDDYDIESTGTNVGLVISNGIQFTPRSGDPDGQCSVYFSTSLRLANDQSFETGPGDLLSLGTVATDGNQLTVRGPGRTAIANASDNDTINVDFGGSLSSSNYLKSVRLLNGTIQCGFSGEIENLTTSATATGKISPGVIIGGDGHLHCDQLFTLSPNVIFEIEAFREPDPIDPLISYLIADTLKITGTAVLSGPPQLVLSHPGPLEPLPGDSFKLIDKTSPGTVQGTFAGKPEGASFAVGRFTWQITYAGGDGNDVVLTCTGITPTGTLRTWTGAAGNSKWTNAQNWSGNAVPQQGDDLRFPDTVVSNLDRIAVNDFPHGYFFNSITVQGPSYHISGSRVALAAGLSALPPAGAVTRFDCPVQLTQNLSIASGPGMLQMNGDILLGPHQVTLAVGGGMDCEDITGAGSVVKSGSGNLLLLGDRSYTGSTTIQGGTVYVTTANGLGPGSSTLITGGVLNIGFSAGAPLLVEDITVQGSGKLVGYSTGNSTLRGTLTLQTSGGVNLEALAGTTLHVESPTGGTAAPRIGGAGTVRFDGAATNTWPGAATVSSGILELARAGAAVTGNVIVNGGTLALGAANQIPDTATVTLGPGALFDVRDYTETLTALSLDGAAVQMGTGILTLNGNLTCLDDGAASTIGGRLRIAGGARTWTVTDGAAADDLVVTAVVETADASSLTKSGPGRMVVNTGSLLPDFTAQQGETYFNAGNLTSVALAGGTLSGGGIVGSVTSPGAGALAPGMAGTTAQLSMTNALTLTAANTFRARLLDSRPGGTGHDTVAADGAVNLGGATLALTILQGFAALPGDQFMIVKNNSANPVTGTFAGLPQGAAFSAGGKGFTISYTGGNGNDVVLTAAFNVKTWTGAHPTSADWTQPQNWSGNAAPAAGDALVFPDPAARKPNNNNFSAGTAFRFINISGTGYDLQGNGVTLAEGLHCPANGADNDFRLPITLSQPQRFSRTGSADLRLSTLATINTNGHELTVDCGTGATFQANGIISGAGGLRVTGGSEFSLNAANTYTGLTTLESGTLVVANAASLGGTSGGTGLTGGTLLVLTSAAVVEPFTAGSPPALILTSGAAATLSGPIALNDGAVLECRVQGTQLSLTGAISGAGILNKTHGGTLVLSGSAANTLTGPVIVAAGTSGTVRLAKTGGVPAIGSGGAVIGATTQLVLDAASQIADSATVTVEGGIFDTNGLNETISFLNMTGGTARTGAGTLTVTSGVRTYPAATAAAIQGKLHHSAAQSTWDVADGAAADDLLVSALVSGGAVQRFGAGRAVLSGANTHSSFVQNEGATLVNGTTVTAFQLEGGTLGGNGRVAGLIATSEPLARTVAPGSSAGLLRSSGNVALTPGTVFAAELRNQSTPGTTYDQLDVTGTVALNNATLAVSLLPPPGIEPGDRYTIIANDGTDAVTGTFAGLPEGALVDAAGDTFAITYRGGTGNDVVLSAIVPPSGRTLTWTGLGANPNWSTTANWSPAAAPGKGDELVFPAGVTQRNSVNDLAVMMPLYHITISGGGYTISGANGVMLSTGFTLSQTTGTTTWSQSVRLLAPQAWTCTAAGGSVVMSGPVDTNGQELTLSAVDAANSLTVSGIISGSGGLRGAGPGLVAVSANGNDFTGSVIVAGGTLFAAGPGALAPGGQTTVLPGGTLALDPARSSPLAEDIVLDGGTVATIGSAGSVNLDRDIVILTTGSFATPLAGHSLMLGGSLSGAGSLWTKTGPGLLQLAGSEDNPFAGQVLHNGGVLELSKPAGKDAIRGAITAAGELRLRVEHQIPDTSSVVLTPGGIFNLNDLAETLQSLTLTAASITGGPDKKGVLTLNGTLSSLAAETASTVGAEVVFMDPKATRMSLVDVQSGAAPEDLVFVSAFSCPDGQALVKTGAGTLTLDGSGTADHLRLAGGTSLVKAAYTTLPVELDGGSISGNGTVQRITSDTGGGAVMPGNGTGQLSGGAPLTLNAATVLQIEMNSTTAVSGYDRLVATGAVSLGNAQLALILGFTPPAGSVFEILRKTSAGAISGTFAGLPQNALLTAEGGLKFRISYTGGNGNDVTLTLVEFPPPDITSVTTEPGSGPNAGQVDTTITGTGVPGGGYRLERSTDLLLWTPGPTANADPATGALLFEFFDPAVARRFYRLLPQ